VEDVVELELVAVPVADPLEDTDGRDVDDTVELLGPVDVAVLELEELLDPALLPVSPVLPLPVDEGLDVDEEELLGAAVDDEEDTGAAGSDVGVHGRASAIEPV